MITKRSVVVYYYVQIFFKLYVLTVYINSVHTIYSVPDDESIDSKDVDGQK
jgi:hypothetical protein